jgi:hypothetical protein
MSSEILKKARTNTLSGHSIADILAYISNSREVDRRLLDLVLRGVGSEAEWPAIGVPSQEKDVRADLPEELTKLPVRVASLENKILQTTSEVQDIRNLCNKYLKVETREEALRTFGELIASVHGVREVYAVQKNLETIFWVFCDKRDRLDVLEDVVDVECKFERLYRGLDFKYRVLPYAQMDSRLAAQGELVYKSEG